MNWPRARLKHVTRFAYGDTLPPHELQEGPFQVFGSNGPFATFPRANTKSPAIVIGRKGSYGKVNWSKDACFASDTTFFVDETTTHHNLRLAGTGCYKHLGSTKAPTKRQYQALVER